MTAKDIWWQLLLLIIGSYFLGNLNIAFIVSRGRKKDITKQGSGNPGALNMYRNFGFFTGVLTLVVDTLKGAIPVVAGWLIFKGHEYSGLIWGWGSIAMFSAGLAVVLGHVYPVTGKFKGGKGVSSTLGVYFAAASIIYFWYVPLIAFVVAIMYIYFFEWGAVGSLILITTVTVFMIVWYAVNYAFSGGLLAIILINAVLLFLSFWKHRTNLKKLAEGRENRTVLKNIFRRKHKKKEEEQLGENSGNAESVSENQNISTDENQGVNKGQN